MAVEKSVDYPYRNGVRSDISRLLPASATRILELGCGTGSTLRWLGERFPGAYRAGVESYQPVAQRAVETCNQVICGDIEKVVLPFPSEHFDLIIALDVLEHLKDPWRVVERLNSLLAPGGVLIVSLPNVAHYTVVWALLCGRWDYVQSGLLDRTHLRFFVRDSAVDLLESAGLKVDRCEFTLKMPNWLSMVYWSVTGFGRRLAKHLPLFRLFHFRILIRGRRTQESGNPTIS